ncbi:MAG: serine hydrolase [Reichenbachiella sp.]|uniref:serine hydrolase domain-containing protein n=1 Tax=Reichenbachiella sp. TaxID=2184521 RepID=UPI0032986C5F
MNPVEKDSLYAQWSKSKTTLPTLFYSLSDFNDFSDRVEAESLIRMYGVGGVIVPNGNSQEVGAWINKNKNWRSEPLIHVASIKNIFEFPFETETKYPSQLSVECFNYDSLAYWLGQAHAYDFKKLGIGLVQIRTLPSNYSKHELKKVDLYLQGLESGHIAFFFGDEATLLAMKQPLLDLTKSEFITINQIDQKDFLEKKTLKKYRKETRDKRIVWSLSNQIENDVQQIERGVGIMMVSRQAKPQSLINTILNEKLPTKGAYKQQAKDYFRLLSDIETNLALPMDEKKNWARIKGDYEFQEITLIQNPNDLVPVSHLEQKRIFTISENEEFRFRIDKYLASTHLSIQTIDQGFDSLMKKLPSDALVIADLTALKNSQALESALILFDSLSQNRSVIVMLHGNEEIIKNRKGRSAMIWNPNPSDLNMDVMVEMVFGARSISGALPGYYSQEGSRKGISVWSNGRLSYMPKKELQIDQNILNQIDTLIEHAIREEMMPGCQIMMVKDGQVVYDKNFGFLTYDSLTPVQWDHVYDIASVTKTVATVPALMHRMDKGKVKLNGSLGEYLSNIDTTKAQLVVDDILTHQSGLKSYIPFWRNAKYFTDSAKFLYKKRKWRRSYTYHPINWNDSIQSWISKSSYNSLSNQDGTYRYLYSDLGFILMKDLVEENCDCAFDQSLDDLVYKPMGMNFTTFNPLTRMSKERIAPTEKDKYFRSELLRGVVHDKNAALLGGVSGHAGLFSNANDLAKYMQMLLQGGYYGGVRYFSDSVVRIFTTKKNINDRRAMGWDKPYHSVGNASKYASEESFGHSGFTGTLVWADPKYNLVYIFLSNRIYPDPQNYKLIESNTRTKIHDLMYESFLNLAKESNSGS